MSLTLQEFQNKYLGKQVEYHSFGALAFNQCVDLINAYINQCLDNTTKDYTEIIGTNAKDFGTKYDKEDFDWIANTPTGVPQRGDIMVWNGNAGGGAGHVSIYLSGDASFFKSLDQNWSQVERVTLENHNYNNVIGWLRPKNLGGGVDVNELEKATQDRDRNWRLYDGLLTSVCNVLGITIPSDKLSFDKQIVVNKINELKNRPAGDPIAEKIRTDLKSWLA